MHTDKHKTVTGQEEEYLNDGPYMENAGPLAITPARNSGTGYSNLNEPSLRMSDIAAAATMRGEDRAKWVGDEFRRHV